MENRQQQREIERSVVLQQFHMQFPFLLVCALGWSLCLWWIFVVFRYSAYFDSINPPARVLCWKIYREPCNSDSKGVLCELFCLFHFHKFPICRLLPEEIRWIWTQYKSPRVRVDARPKWIKSMMDLLLDESNRLYELNPFDRILSLSNEWSPRHWYASNKQRYRSLLSYRASHSCIRKHDLSFVFWVLQFSSRLHCVVGCSKATIKTARSIMKNKH